MIELNSFINRQQKIYEQFHAAAVRVKQEGLCLLIEDRDGYVIFLKHPEKIVECCSHLSEKIAAVVPAVIYTKASIHTTLAVIGMQHRPSEEQSIDPIAVNLLLETLSVSVGNCSSINIPYQSWLYNQDTVIAPGFASNSFVNLINYIHNTLGEHHIQEKIGKIQQPWGGHITISRFLEKTPLQELENFFDLISKEPPLPLSKPESICLGYVSIKNGYFTVEVQGCFPLHD